jgi:hypothetical protein
MAGVSFYLICCTRLILVYMHVTELGYAKSQLLVAKKQSDYSFEYIHYLHSSQLPRIPVSCCGILPN